MDLAARIKLELTVGAVMSFTIKSLMAEATDDAELDEPSMVDMSRETFDFLHECRTLLHRADLALHTVDMHRFLAQSGAVDREITEMLATPY